MLLEELLNVSNEEAMMASDIFIADERYDPIMEATARVLRFDYERARNDPRPRVLVLGRWLHPQTRNKLVAGINLNYLNRTELKNLQKYMPRIMGQKSLKNKWWTGFGLLPKIWSKAYRQYDERFIHSIKQASTKPSTKDYEEPEVADADIPQDAQDKINKLREIEAEKEGKPPKDKSKKGLIRLSKDAIKKLASLIRNKLRRNKKRKIEKPEQEPETEIEPESDKDNELEDLNDIEQEHENEYEANEERYKNIDAIIEHTVKQPLLEWKSPANYINWHLPHKFVEYQPRLRGRILDYSHGSKLAAVYNIEEDKLIIDLVDDINTILMNSGWAWDNTIRVTIDEKKTTIDYNKRYKDKLSSLTSHDFWEVIQEVTDFQ